MTLPQLARSARSLGALAMAITDLTFALTPPHARAATALSPDQELAGFELADPTLRVELVAAEPMVTSPVAIAWDSQLRLYVAEMNDYPTATEGGRIRRLEDQDGDGRMDASVIFADGLHFPASVQPWRDGVLVAAAPDILFLRDTDGDGRADERRVVLSGFGEGNQQLRVNGLTFALDGWVHGANGRSDGELRGPGLSSPVSLRRSDFRFDPDSGRAEALAGPSQFGIAFDAEGNRFLSWNTIFARHELIPASHLARAPVTLSRDSLIDCLEPATDPRIYPIAPAPQTFNRESVTHFNALAGLHIYGGDVLGPEYTGSAFAGETLRGLIHRRRLERRGPTFAARRAETESQREFLASRDPWCHPVNLTTGPDGALYFCDFYRRWVEHPGFVPAHLRGTVDWREGWEHGRIWRITRRAAAAASGSNHPRGPVAGDTQTLVERLSDANAWQRLTAQRLLLETREPAATPHLRRLVRTTAPQQATARLHSLWLLHGLAELAPSDLRRGLADPDPRVRRAALRIARLNPTPPRQLIASISRLARDPDPAVRFEVALGAGSLPPQERAETCSRILQQDGSDPRFVQAILASHSTDLKPLLAPLDEVVRRSSNRTPEPLPWLFDLGRHYAAQSAAEDPRQVREAFVNVSRSAWARESTAVLFWTAGFIDGLFATARSARTVLALDNPEAAGSPVLGRIRFQAEQSLNHEAEPLATRTRALTVLTALLPAADLPGLHRYLEPSAPIGLQQAAAESLFRIADAATATELLRRATAATPRTRRQLLLAAGRRTETLGPLLSSIESGAVSPMELDPAAREQLLRHSNPELARRAQACLNRQVDAERGPVIERYRPALAQTGSGPRGAKVFERHCQVCHRIGTVGGQVGPDLSGIGSRNPEILLVDILDPSRAVAPEFLAYTLTTRDGDSRTGLLVHETAEAIGLRQANVPDEIIPRARISSLRPEGKSLMPDGLEAGFSVEELADLLAFLAAPETAGTSPAP